MEKVALKELFEKPISGEWGGDPEEVDNGAVGVIRSTNFTKDIRFNQQSEIVQRVIDSKKIASKKLKIGDIVIEKSGGGPTQPVGRVLYYDLDDHEIRLCNNFTSILRPKEYNEPKYLAYLMQNLYNRGQVLKYQNKTTGIINLKLDNYLKDTEVEVTPLQTQLKIVQVLDKSQSLIDKRKEQIKLMDKLIQSTFYEMFGDPVANPKGWRTDIFEDGISILTDYHANGSYKTLKSHVELLDKPGYALMIRSTDLQQKEYKHGVKYISKRAYEFLSKTKVYGGEIIINKIGNAGKVYYMPFLNRRVSLGMNQFLVRTNYKLSCMYIFYLFNTVEGKSLIMSRVRGAVTKSITKDAIREIVIPYPPIELQNQFAEIVLKIEVQKQLMERSLSEMENNYNSLMQRAFSTKSFN